MYKMFIPNRKATHTLPQPISDHLNELASDNNYFKKLIDNAEADYIQNGVYPLSSDIYQSGLKIEVGESILIDLKEHPHNRIEPLPDEIIEKLKLRNTEFRLWMRPEVRSALIQLTENLPSNWGIYIFEAYRTPEDQKARFLKYRDRLIEEARAQNSPKTDEEIEKELEKLMCPVRDNITPPHTTGGAVELFLVDLNTKELIPMGFNFTDWTKTPPTHYKGEMLTDQEKKNRSILLQAATKAGFINYPGDCWQFNLGNNIWSAITGRSLVYGLLTEEQARKCLKHDDLTQTSENERSLSFT